MTPEERHAAKRLGTVLGGRWTLERVLGVGGMAAVYAARASDGSLAALKLLHAESRLNAEVRQRFLREGLAANRVEHPGAVRVLDHAAESEEDPYLVMELLEGESLAQRRAREPLSPDELLDMLDQTLDVLIAAHDRGIVHRDLKPDNLFLTRGGTVKVLDFGIARFLDAVPGDLKTRTGIAMGTLPYMAPEQALGKRDQIDGRTDLFALGAVAFRLMTGRRVHEADSEAGLLVAMATLPAPPLKSVVPEVPNWIAAIVDLSLAFARDGRYPDARTMQSDVRAVRSGSPPPYASRTSSTREEATRADRPAAKVALEPAATAPTTPAARALSAGSLPAVTAWPAPRFAGTPPGYAVSRAPLAASSARTAQPDKPKPDRRLVIVGAALALMLLTLLVIGVGVAASGAIGSSQQADAGDGGVTPVAAEAERKPTAAVNDHEADKRAQEKQRESQKKLDEARREADKKAQERVKEWLKGR